MKLWNRERVDSPNQLVTALNRLEKSGMTIFALLPCAPMALAEIVYYMEKESELAIIGEAHRGPGRPRKEMQDAPES